MQLSTDNRLHQVCEAREDVLDLLIKARALINQANVVARFYGLGCIETLFRDSGIRYTTVKDSAPGGREHSYVAFTKADRDTLARYLDAPAWDTLGKASGLVACMHTEARKAWDSQIARFDVPPLTMDNINAALGAVHDNRRDVLEEGVVAVFKSLSYDYKSNAPVKFGKRVVLARFHMGTPHWYSPGPEKCSQVDDLLRLMQLADGKVSHEQYVTLSAMSASKVKDTGTHTLETDYYTLKVFKKGTAHIVFKRKDLVDKLNMAIGKKFPNALPAPV